MLVFHPPYNSLRRMGQADASTVPASMTPTAPAQPVVVVPAPAVVAPAAPAAPNYDTGVNLSAAGIVVGGIALLGIAFSVSRAFAKRRA